MCIWATTPSLVVLEKNHLDISFLYLISQLQSNPWERRTNPPRRRMVLPPLLLAVCSVPAPAPQSSEDPQFLAPHLNRKSWFLPPWRRKKQRLRLPRMSLRLKYKSQESLRLLLAKALHRWPSAMYPTRRLNDDWIGNLTASTRHLKRNYPRSESRSRHSVLTLGHRLEREDYKDF